MSGWVGVAIVILYYRVTISSADLALTNSNIPQALQLLQQITQDKP